MIKHDYSFDPTNGHTLEQLLAIRGPEEPAGFKEFWEETYKLVRAMTPTYFIERELWSPNADERIYRIRVKNPEHIEKGVRKMTVDGEEAAKIPVFTEGIHLVEILMGRKEGGKGQ